MTGRSPCGPPRTMWRISSTAAAGARGSGATAASPKQRLGRIEQEAGAASHGRRANDRSGACGGEGGQAKRSLDENRTGELGATAPRSASRARVQTPGLRGFEASAPSYRRMVVAWLLKAKRPETRKRRIAEIVKRSDRGLRPSAVF